MQTSKKLLLLILFNFTFFSLLLAQWNENPCYAIKWSKNYGSATDDYLFAMEPTSDGGFIAVGEMRATGREDTDIWVQKINSVGEVIWSRTYGVNLNERAKDVLPISNGNFVVLAEAERTRNSLLFQDIQLLEIDQTGEVIKENLLGAPGISVACNLEIMPNGNYLIGAIIGGTLDVWVIQLDENLNNINSLAFNRPTLVGYTIAKPYGLDILVVSSNLGFSEELETPAVEGIEVRVITSTIPFQVIQEFEISSPFGFNFLPTYSPNSVSINGSDLIIGTIQIGINSIPSVRNQFVIEDIFQNESRGTVTGISTDSLHGGYSAITQLPNGQNLAGLTVFNPLNNMGVPIDSSTLDVRLAQISSDLTSDTIWFDRFGAPFGGSKDDFRVVAVHVVEDGIVVAANSMSSDGDLPGNFGGVDGWIFKIGPLEKPDLGPYVAVCDGQPILLHTGSSYFQYNWQDGSTDSTFLVETSGTYSVTVSDAARRCELSHTVTIELLDLELNLGPTDTILCNPEGLLLTTNLPEGTTFEWQDGSTNPDFIAKQAGTYVVTAQFGDCILIDSINVTLCDSCVEIPNAFSPNGDNLNDTFHPYVGCVINQYNFKVYNRWGQVVFESSTFGEEWDGTIDGKDAPSDNYVYIVTFEREDQGRLLQEVRRGEVVLLR